MTKTLRVRGQVKTPDNFIVVNCNQYPSLTITNYLRDHSFPASLIIDDISNSQTSDYILTLARDMRQGLEWPANRSVLSPADLCAMLNAISSDNPSGPQRFGPSSTAMELEATENLARVVEGASIYADTFVSVRYDGREFPLFMTIGSSVVWLQYKLYRKILETQDDFSSIAPSEIPAVLWGACQGQDVRPSPKHKITSKHLTLGADPELLIYPSDGDSGAQYGDLLPAESFFGGRATSGIVGTDGCADVMEIRPKYSASPYKLAKNVRKCLIAARDKVYKGGNVFVEIGGGCRASIGGHIHFGHPIFGKLCPSEIRVLTTMLDDFLYFPIKNSMVGAVRTWGRPVLGTDRRDKHTTEKAREAVARLASCATDKYTMFSEYDQPGQYRPQPWGIEYRSLPSFVVDEKFTRIIFRISKGLASKFLDMVKDMSGFSYNDPPAREDYVKLIGEKDHDSWAAYLGGDGFMKNVMSGWKITEKDSAYTPVNFHYRYEIWHSYNASPDERRGLERIIDSAHAVVKDCKPIRGKSLARRISNSGVQNISVSTCAYDGNSYADKYGEKPVGNVVIVPGRYISRDVPRQWYDAVATMGGPLTNVGLSRYECGMIVMADKSEMRKILGQDGARARADLAAAIAGGAYAIANSSLLDHNRHSVDGGDFWTAYYFAMVGNGACAPWDGEDDFWDSFLAKDAAIKRETPRAFTARAQYVKDSIKQEQKIQMRQGLNGGIGVQGAQAPSDAGLDMGTLRDLMEATIRVNTNGTYTWNTGSQNTSVGLGTLSISNEDEYVRDEEF